MPALHILMTSKNEKFAYSLVSSLHQCIPDFTPLIAKCDKKPRETFFEKFSSSNSCRLLVQLFRVIGEQLIKN